MRRKIDVLILLAVLITGGLALKNAQAVGDWWHARLYSPPTAVASLAEDAGMNTTGTRYFYRFSPQLVDQATLDEKCDYEKLGCTEGRYIYILDASTPAEHNRAVVTAAHEMLHVAYSRLSPGQQSELEPLLSAELATPAAADIVEVLKGYPAADYFNEAHSFIGSQLPDISGPLERHYDNYFSDRAKSTQAFAHSPENP